MLVKENADVWVNGLEYALHGDLYTLQSYGWMMLARTHNHDIKKDDCEIVVNDDSAANWTENYPNKGDVYRLVELDEGGELLVVHRGFTGVRPWFAEYCQENNIEVPQ